jgi:hypothetical protein
MEGELAQASNSATAAARVQLRSDLTLPCLHNLLSQDLKVANHALANELVRMSTHGRKVC